MKIYLALTLWVLYTSCTQSGTYTSEKNTKEYLAEFSQTSLTNRGDNYIFQVFYTDGYHSYYLNKDKDELHFIRDTMISKTVTRNFVSNPNSLKKEDIEKLIKDKLIFMEEHDISEYRSDWRFGGIDIKVYFKDGTELFYIEDINNVQSKEWKSLVASYKKLPNHWYYNDAN